MIENLIINRILFILIVMFAVSHFLLISFIIMVWQIIYLKYYGELGSEKNIRIIVWTLILLILFSIGWVSYIMLINFYNNELNLSFFETLRKLYNYPKIYEKFVLPIFNLKISSEIAIAFCSIFMILFIEFDNKKNKAIGFMLSLLLIGICGTGIADTFYNHIRYFYYLYPLFLILISIAIISSLIKFSKKKFLKIAIQSGLTVFLILQLYTSWEKIVNASVGSEERFSYSRVYLDHKTCGNYLNEQYAGSDYVITFASATQIAAYFEGTINVCIKPKLNQYKGQELHYITGSKFFETKEDLGLLVKENANNNEQLWIFIDKRYRNKEFWGREFIEKLGEYTVCEAVDNYTSLAKISYQQFFELLGPF